MQQFFALINNVLQGSPDTQKRKLRIVTYRVRAAAAMSQLLLVGSLSQHTLQRQCNALWDALQCHTTSHSKPFGEDLSDFHFKCTAAISPVTQNGSASAQ